MRRSVMLQRKPGALASAFILKIAGRCNLNCSYCYMFNKGDVSFRSRPKAMSAEVAEAMLRRIAGYANRHQLHEVSLALHGGEPLLIGSSWVRWFLAEAQQVGDAHGVTFKIGAQTNGTLLDRGWLELFAQHSVTLGISCDGPQHLHDRFRRDFAGRGSYLQVRQAIELLAAEYEHPWGILTVANPVVSASSVLRHFTDIGARKIDFLWPDYNHDNPPPWASGTLAQYFIELFDCWYGELKCGPRIRWFESALSLLFGGPSGVDALGPHPITDIMVESDGTWEPLDSLRICGNGMTLTGLDVFAHDVEDLWKVPLYQIGLRNQEQLSAACRACAFGQVCGGGYLPHRFSTGAGFANPSVHCADLFSVLTHIRARIVEDLGQAGVAVAPFAAGTQGELALYAGSLGDVRAGRHSIYASMASFQPGSR